MNNWQEKKRKEKYTRYMASQQWAAKKFDVFRRDGYTCQMCKRNPATQVHHKTYRNFENEPLEDLMSVCIECHREHHGLAGVPSWRIKEGGR